MTSGFVYAIAVIAVGLPAVLALHLVFVAALGVAGLGSVATSSLGMVVGWVVAVVLGLQLAVEVTAVVVGGYQALVRGSPSVAIVRCVLLSGGLLAVIGPITWAGLSELHQMPGPAAATVALFVALCWCVVLYRASTAFVGGFRTGDE